MPNLPHILTSYDSPLFGGYFTVVGSGKTVRCPSARSKSDLFPHISTHSVPLLAGSDVGAILSLVGGAVSRSRRRQSEQAD